MLKYEEKLHFDKLYDKLNQTRFHKISNLVWAGVGYVVLYYLSKSILTLLPDFQPWSRFQSWLFWGGVRFSRIDFLYFACGLVLTGYSALKLSKITIQNHSVRSDKGDKPKELLTSGCYAKTRHPMYGTFIILQAGFMLTLRSLDGIIAALILIAVQFANAIVEEKKQLIPLFGEEYKLYARNVNRMLLTCPETITLTLMILLSCLGFIL